MTTTITRRFEFDAAHRVLGHEGKCRHLHGHRYVAEVAVEAPELDALGRVIDFSVMKTKIGDWIDNTWDHNILLNSNDPLNIWQGGPTGIQPEDVFNGKKPFIFQGTNPTAEVIARYLYYIASISMTAEGIKVVKVRIYETPNCYADYTPDQLLTTLPINHDNRP